MEKMSQTFCLWSPEVKTHLFNFLHPIPVDGTFEVIVRNISQDKTLKQLGALFGLWVKYEAARQGESEDEIHRSWKNKFLARIYCIEPANNDQESWVELLAVYQGGESEKFKKHAERISLSWATLDQTKEYMNQIENHYQAIGFPLPIPDKYYKLKLR